MISPLDTLAKGHCKTCGRVIFWAKTPRGRSIPLDPEPRIGGNIVLRRGLAVVDEPRTELERRYRLVSHFATCPQAELFRKANDAKAVRP